MARQRTHAAQQNVNAAKTHARVKGNVTSCYPYNDIYEILFIYMRRDDDDRSDDDDRRQRCPAKRNKSRRYHAYRVVTTNAAQQNDDMYNESVPPNATTSRCMHIQRRSTSTTKCKAHKCEGNGTTATITEKRLQCLHTHDIFPDIKDKIRFL